MTDADPGMGSFSAVSPRPALSPIGMLWLFARSAAVAAVFASALCAGLYIVRDMRSSAVPSSTPSPIGNIDVPGGLELLTPLRDARGFQRTVGFAPVLPDRLPEGTAATPRLDARQPDASGARTGELRFQAQRDAARNPLGPSLLLIESARRDAAASEPALVAPGTYAATVACGAIVIEARLFFPATGDAPKQLAAAQAFVGALAAQCAR